MAQLSYRRHRFPAEIIQHAIWLYLRFTLSYRDVEELLAECGLDVFEQFAGCARISIFWPELSSGTPYSALPLRQAKGTSRTSDEDDGKLYRWHLQFDRLLPRARLHARHIHRAVSNRHGPRSPPFAMDRSSEPRRPLDRRRLDRGPGVVGDSNTPAGSDNADRQPCT